MKSDFLIVGAGPFGCAFARRATDLGKQVLVIDRRDHVAGNAADSVVDGISVHRYGAHIFHTNDEDLWRFVNQFGPWRQYEHRVMARNGKRVFSMPINLRTLHQLWCSIDTPGKVQDFLARVQSGERDDSSIESWCLTTIGHDLYELAVKHYTEKQWGRPCSSLPASIVRRLPVRMTWDDRYYNDRFQGLPDRGYTALFTAMLDGVPVGLGEDYLAKRSKWSAVAKDVVFTGPIDAYFDHCHGELEYRGLRFETERLEGDFQGCPVMNYTGPEVPFTRVHEWKHFGRQGHAHTLITREYPHTPMPGDEPYYPIRDEINSALYQAYRRLAEIQGSVYFGGRLGGYQYLDMHQAIAGGLALADKLCGG